MGRPWWDGWTWFWLGVPFALSGSLAAETASARESERERDIGRGLGEGSKYCVGQGSRLADVVQEKKVGGNLRAEAKKAVDEIDARFQGFGGCSLGVHEDGWMRWVAVEPCQLELRVSLWGDQSPESPFSILHLAGLMGIGHRGSTCPGHACTYYRTCTPYSTSALTELFLLFILPDTRVWSRLIFSQDFPGLPSTG